MKFLIAGFGSIGRRHLRNLLELGEKDILLLRSQKSTLPTEEIAAYPTYTHLGEALAQRPDAVIIANPTALHLDVAIPAAQAGCSIFMEKPISHNLDGIERLQAALESGGGRLLVGYQFRYHPTLQQAAEVLHSGQIGRLLSLRAHWGEYLPGWHPWEDYRQSYAARADLGGGVVRTLCHPLDYVRWLAGDFSALSAAIAPLPELALTVDAVADILVRFRSGASGSIHLDYVQRPAEHQFTAIGTRGSLRWNNADGELLVWQGDEPQPQQFLPPQGFERNQLFLAQMRHFIAVARGEESPCCTLEDGKQALSAALAALESGQGQGLQRIELPAA